MPLYINNYVNYTRIPPQTPKIQYGSHQVSVGRPKGECSGILYLGVRGGAVAAGVFLARGAFATPGKIPKISTETQKFS